MRERRRETPDETRGDDDDEAAVEHRVRPETVRQRAHERLRHSRDDVHGGHEQPRLSSRHVHVVGDRGQRRREARGVHRVEDRRGDERHHEPPPDGCGRRVGAAAR